VDTLKGQKYSWPDGEKVGHLIGILLYNTLCHFVPEKAMMAGLKAGKEKCCCGMRRTSGISYCFGLLVLNGLSCLHLYLSSYPVKHTDYQFSHHT